MKLFDSHAHYDDARFDIDRAALLGSLPSFGVCAVVNAGSCIKSSKASVKLAEAFSFIYAAVGTHPHEAASFDDCALHETESLCTGKRVVAVGEIGLDYHYDHSPRSTQQRCFEQQLDLAVKTGLPVVVHSREAENDVLGIIKNSGVKDGVIHCFTGDMATAKKILDLSFHIGIGGAATFNKSSILREAIKYIPADRILIETDAPYQTPVPYQGIRNDSTLLVYIAETIASVKKTGIEIIINTTRVNAQRLFKTAVY